MKFIRTPWAVFLNLMLILLPWIVAGAFLYQFGQPALQQFKRFLGNPVTEILQTSKAIKENPAEPIPYSRFQRQFQQISIRDTLSDTEERDLRVTTHNLYQGIIRRLDTGQSLATARTQSDSFFRLLENPLIPKIFERPTLLKTSLEEDLKRLNQAAAFPYHPARGIDQFLDKTNVAEQLIRNYGEIYADRLFCQRMGGVECEIIYDESVQVISQQLEQYLRNWPTLYNVLPSRAESLNERLPRLISVFQQLGDDGISGYLEAPPWKTRHGFRATHNQFLKEFQQNLRNWYIQIIKRIDSTPEQFTGSTPEDLLDNLSQLTRLEQRIINTSAARNLLWNEKTLQARKDLAERLRETYHWIQANDRFTDDFVVAENGLDQLTETLSILPRGKEIINEEQQIFTKIETEFNRLKTRVEARQYNGLANAIERLGGKARSSDSELGWSIMLRSFLNDYRERVTRPGWQPLDEGDQASYSRVIRAFGETGQQLQVRGFTNSWVDRTILAMKSRRFNQLKHNIERLVENLQSADIPQLTQQLEAITALEELPDKLQDQPERILFHTVLLERIQLAEQNLYKHFEETIDQEPVWKEQWERINTLMQARESLPASDVLDQLDLVSYVDEFDQWLNRIPTDQPFASRIREELLDVLKQFFRNLEEKTVAWVGQPGEDPGTDRLLKRIEVLDQASDRATTLNGFTYRFQGDPWINLLEFRQRLTGAIETANSIEKGSLMGSNSTYNEFQTKLEEYRYRPFPDTYNPAYEWKQLQQLHRSVMERARKIQAASQEDWLVGWGGRISGDEVLAPWKTFLENWSGELGEVFPRDELRQWLESIQQQEEGWS